ncbi:MAG: hypothetical protein HY332_15220 [Chloroflexi bacterium]|nr:hypothetical protein [Chloroflexota bacterium]
MRDTRIIFVEGIMGSGKSTTASFVTDQFQRNGIAACFISEGGPLRVALDLLHPLAVWRDVTVEDYVERSLRKWHAFAREAAQSATVTVCDGLLFHGNVTDLLLMGAKPPILRRYVARVIECIDDLRPVVISFHHADVAQALRAVCDARGSMWEAYQVTWKLSSPYAVQRSLRGFDGLVQLYRVYRTICDDLFAQLALPKLAILNEGDWATYRTDILTFLQLPPAPPEERAGL